MSIVQVLFAFMAGIGLAGLAAYGILLLVWIQSEIWYASKDGKPVQIVIDLDEVRESLDWWCGLQFLNVEEKQKAQDYTYPEYDPQTLGLVWPDEQKGKRK